MDPNTLFSPFNITLAVLAVTMFFFVWGKVRSDLVALCSLLALILFGILEPVEGLAGFSNTVVLMMVGLFVIGGGILRTGLAKTIGSKILKMARGNENKLFVLIMLVTAFIGAFISNTGTVAIMMPIVISMAAAAKLNLRRYLMPLAFASAMGIFTLISTPPNMIVQDTLIKNGFEPLSFFSFAPLGFIAVSVGVLVLFFSSRLLKEKKDNKKAATHGKTLTDLIEEYNLYENIWKITVPGETALIGKTLAELKLPATYDIGIRRITRTEKAGPLLKKEFHEMAKSDSVIKANDILFCHGSIENVRSFAAQYNLAVSEISEHERKSDADEYGMAEVIILPESSLVNRTILESQLREHYHISVIGVKRKEGQLTDKIWDTKMQPGDILLVSGKWDDIALLSDNPSDIVVIGQPQKEALKVTLDKKAPLAALILIAMVAVMTLNLMPSVTAVLVAAVLMVATGCLKNMEEAYSNINWNSIVLFAAMIPMATAFDKTGITAFLSNTLTEVFGSSGPYPLLISVYCFTSLLSLFISNTATAVLFAPIAIKAAMGITASPYPFLMAVAVAASMCFASPFSTPPNALVMNAGNYTFGDYIKVGLPLQIIMGIVMLIGIPLIFPF